MNAFERDSRGQIEEIEPNNQLGGRNVIEKRNGRKKETHNLANTS